MTRSEHELGYYLNTPFKKQRLSIDLSLKRDLFLDTKLLEMLKALSEATEVGATF